MTSRFFATLVITLLFPLGILAAAPEKSPPKSSDSLSTAEDLSQPTATPSLTPTTQNKLSKNQQPGKILFIHKPMPSPAWGKVIQYHRDQILALSEKNRETIHEFLFQDDAGVIRTATFHENSSGEGYWEVWIWDQP